MWICPPHFRDPASQTSMLYSSILTKLRGMGFWSEIVGQRAAVETLTTALQAERAAQLAHAWLLIGPPGSGRFNLALRFAAALVAAPTASAAELEETYQQVLLGTHPDVKLVRTQTNELGVAQMREAVANAYFAPAVSPRRVIVIEDADRMNSQAANATLKALEEPPESTVWLLCSPSEADLLPTIRSRTRVLRLTTPDVAVVAELLQQRDGVAAELALQAAKLAQGHIGMARQLATNEDALQRRLDTVAAVLTITNLAAAMQAATKLHQAAQQDAEEQVAAQLEQERTALYHSLGLQPGEKIPRDYSRAFKELEESSKRRLTRATIDGVDRVLLDLLTVCRDILALQLHRDTAGPELINEAHAQQLKQLSTAVSTQKICAFATELETARGRLGRNIQPALVLEAALVSLITIPN
ncbi:DNA polymerase III subunit delta' [Leucobacter sp. OH2974_COT-288]|nr:DNA polymerase III subunit delta' [Leucobacter sp. OH2974_COT-288]